MTDIDIDQIRRTSQQLERPATHYDGCAKDHFGCAVLALIERLKQVEDERNNLLDRLTCMCGDDMDRHPQWDGHSPTSMYDHYRLEWDDMKQRLSEAEALRSALEVEYHAVAEAHDAWECRAEKAEAQRDRLRAGVETVITQLAGSIVHSIPVCQPELESYNRKLRELLEGGE